MTVSPLGRGASPGKFSRRLFCVLLLVTGLTALGFDAGAADPFYEQLLRDGERAQARGDLAQAERYFRLASFGLLDEPPALVTSLARLALLQAAREEENAFRETFARILDIEDRFGSYSQHPLPADIGADFEAAALRLVPRATLESSPAFKALAARLDPPSETVGGVETAAADTALAEQAVEALPLPGDPPPADPGSAAEERSEPSLPTQAGARLDQARQLLRRAQTVSDLDRPLELARSVADAHPDSARAQHLVAEIAYRASRWKEAATYFRRGGDPGEDQPTLLFFMAVSQYESGDRTTASATLQRCLPRLERTLYVQRYVEKILGDRGS